MQDKSELRKIVIARRDAIEPDVRAEKSARVCAELSRMLDRLSSDGNNPIVSVFSAMGSEVDLSAFVQAAYAHGARVAFPCMVKNPAWSKEGERTACAADRPNLMNEANEAARSNTPNEAGPANGPDAPGETNPAFTPRLLMEFRLVSSAQLSAGVAPFVSRPLRSFPPGAPELSPFPYVTPEQVDFAACPLVAFDATGMRLGYGGGNYDAFLPRLRPEATIVGVAFAEQEVPVGTIPIEPHDLPLPHIIRA